MKNCNLVVYFSVREISATTQIWAEGTKPGDPFRDDAWGDPPSDPILFDGWSLVSSNPNLKDRFLGFFLPEVYYLFIVLG